MASESDVFTTMFTLPQGNKPNAEGTSPNNPIKLPEEIKSEDFKALLKVLYPLKYVFTKLNLDWQVTFMLGLLPIQVIRI